MKDYGDVFGPVPEKEVGADFENVFPTGTKGNGKVVANNKISGAGQGKGSPKRKVRCKMCGFLVDSSKNDSSGGSLDGNGAGGTITSISDGFGGQAGDQAYKKSSGCPLCFSKNNTQNPTQISPIIEPRKDTLGF